MVLYASASLPFEDENITIQILLLLTYILACIGLGLVDWRLLHKYKSLFNPVLY